MVLSCAFLALWVGATLQPTAQANRAVSVDEAGVLRWEDDGTEVSLLGVNYYPPFAIDFQQIQSKGLDADRIIREDVAHFQRLGLTAIRLHCFDRQISDADGTLKDNEHLRLLDVLLSQCKDRGIYAVLTPIAWWPPEGGGFSDQYTMPEMTTDLQARKAQCAYLSQFADHVNRYTGLAYKEDPGIIAFELINEPLYPEKTPDAGITEYIDALANAIRSTGCQKPLFYHAWLGQRFQACARSSVEGVSFGWYPTGLASGAMIESNVLPLVDDYPLMREPVLSKKAKIVYEFDAADIHAGFMYPAMARAFRAAGCQIATQFQYDPMALADTNVNWQTHYLNLAYTPGKAVSLAIAAEVFRQIPRFKDFGRSPQCNAFGDFRVSFERGLSEYVTEETFLYSNDTEALAPCPERLQKIVGVGSSSVVQYRGLGAYFLDKEAPGVWSLQVFPDPVMIQDPYAGGSSEKVRLLWHEHEMGIHLPDLGEGFAVFKKREAQEPEPRSRPGQRGFSFEVEPGEYLLVKKGGAAPSIAPLWGFLPSPAPSQPIAVRVQIPGSWREGLPLHIEATVASAEVRSCRLLFKSPEAGLWETFAMKATDPYQFQTTLPSDLLKPGSAQVALEVKDPEGRRFFPGRRTVSPDQDSPGIAPVDLLKAGDPTPVPELKISGPRPAKAAWVSGREAGAAALGIESDGFVPAGGCVSAEPAIGKLPTETERATSLRVILRGGPDTSGVEISLVQKDGNAFGRVFPVLPAWREVTAPLSDLSPMWWGKGAQAINLGQLDHLSIVFGSWLFGELSDRPHRVEIQSIQLVQDPCAWALNILPGQSPILLAAPSQSRVKIEGRQGHTCSRPGMDGGSLALRISVTGFGEAPDCASFRVQVPKETQIWKDRLQGAKDIVIRARAAQPSTDALELVLLERDSSPWGLMRVPLTQEWQAIRIPLSEFRYYGHWIHESRGRGGPQDRVHLEDVTAINVCFGAWLYPGKAQEPHAIEVEDVRVE